MIHNISPYHYHLLCAPEVRLLAWASPPTLLLLSSQPVHLTNEKVKWKLKIRKKLFPPQTCHEIKIQWGILHHIFRRTAKPLVRNQWFSGALKLQDKNLSLQPCHLSLQALQCFHLVWNVYCQYWNVEYWILKCWLPLLGNHNYLNMCTSIFGLSSLTTSSPVGKLSAILGVQCVDFTPTLFYYHLYSLSQILNILAKANFVEGHWYLF